MQMEVKLIDHMGSDNTVVNAARVSFNKQANEFTNYQNEKLINYLATHKHWSPFAHCFLQFHIKAPIFVARQLAKHQVGLSWNEISRRYVDYEPEFYTPDKWRCKPKDKKQGSSNKYINLINESFDYKDLIKNSKQLYNSLIKHNVAPEMARMVLPQAMHTEWYWSGSLYAFSRIYNLRIQQDSQQETRELVKLFDEPIRKLFPISWEALI